MPSLSLSLFLFMLSSVLSLSSPPSTEFLALHSFFNSTNGHSWEPRCSVNWNFTCLEVGGECPDPCSFSQPWFGVSCFGSNVSSLNLIGCQLSGSLPDALNDLLVLSTLYLDDNNLTSTFPAITKPFRLTQLQAGGNKFTGPFPDLHWGLFSVYLANNFLTGTLSESLLLPDIISFNAGNNFLSGTVPSSLIRNPQLQDVVLSDNLFTGNIPSAITSELDNLNLQNNIITGSMPADICIELCDLTYFQVANNFISGNLPTNFDNTSGIIFFDIRFNMISGTIPDAFQEITGLRDALVTGNLLSGSINPLFDFPTISDVHAASNLFSGPLTLPEHLSFNIQYINVSNNLLTGHFTVCYDDIRYALTDLDASYNLLSGPIPGQLNQVYICCHPLTLPLKRNCFHEQSERLFQLHLGSNFFTSTIPAEIAAMRYNYYLDLSDNFLTGQIPEDELFGDCLQSPTSTSPNCVLNSVILYLFLHQNYLTGPIPIKIGGASALRQLSLFDNQFSGSIPVAFKNLTVLSTVLLQHNLLTGQPGLPFTDNTSFFNLQVVNIGDNLFTGSLPLEFFKLPRLSYFAITRGCYKYSGDLPEEICGAKNLRTLVLEGLQAGDECNSAFWDPLGILNKAYIGSDGDPGTIPSCIWEMPNLLTLHLAGNAMTGTLPSFGNALLSLRDLSLSFNELTGVIPRNIQERGYDNLDLSHNKFSGTFNHVNVSGFNHAEQNNIDYDFRININRLSGAVPSHAKELRNLEILAGNIWSCHSRDDLPENDPQTTRYACGSSTYDAALVVWSSFLGLVLFLGVVSYELMRYYEASQPDVRNSFQKHISSWKLSHLTFRTSLSAGQRSTSIGNSDSFSSGVKIEETATTTRNAGVWLREIVEEFKIWDDAASSTDKNVNPQLFLFLQSLINLRLLAIILAGLIAVMYLPLYAVGKTYYDFGSHTPQYRWLITAAYTSSIEAGFWICALFCIVLLFTVFKVFRDYFSLRSRCTYAESYLGSQALQSRRQTISSSKKSPSNLFKKSFIIFGLVVLNCVFILTFKCGFVFLLHLDVMDPSVQIFLQFTLAIFDIFWNAIVLSRMVLTFPKLLSPNARIQIRLFGLIFNQIIAPLAATGLTDRSCFSELFFAKADNIETFSSINVCDGLGDNGQCFSFSPMVLSTTFSPLFTYKYQCSSSLFTIFLPVLLFSYTLTAFVEPLLIILVVNFSKFEYFNKFLVYIPSILWPTRNRDDEFNKVILPEILYSSLLGHIAVILTYGIASPVVGAAVALMVFIFTWQWHYIIGRYLSVHRRRSHSVPQDVSRSSSQCDTTLSRSSTPRSSEFESSFKPGLGFHIALEHACHDSWRGAVKSVWILVCISAFFMALLLMDIGGDDVGRDKTVTLLLVPIIIMSLLLLAAVKYMTFYIRKIEMSEMESLSRSTRHATRMAKNETTSATQDDAVILTTSMSPFSNSTNILRENTDQGYGDL